jgi:hypothetical protein
MQGMPNWLARCLKPAPREADAEQGRARVAGKKYFAAMMSGSPWEANPYLRRLGGKKRAIAM